MKKSYFLWAFIIMLISTSLHAQNWQLAVKGGGVSVDNVKDIYVDVATGDSYITGTFSGTATFGALASITSSGTTDIFVAKFNTSGTALWVKKAGGNNTSGETATGIWVSPSGECRITGGFYGTATFGTFSVTSAGNSDIYVARYNAATGAEIGVVRFGTAGDESGTKITVDASNNSYIAGRIFNSITFPGLTAITGSIFALKLSPVGTPSWARAGNAPGGSSAIAHTSDIRVDNNGNFYWLGNYSGGEVPSFTIGSWTFNAPYDAAAYFLMKLNSNSGVNVWGRDAITDDSYTGDAMDVDINGDVVISGRCNMPTTFGSITTATGGHFIAKLNAAGTYTVGKIVSNSGSDVRDLDTDCKANIYLTGSLYGTCSFTGLPALTSTGNSDVYAAKFNPTATALWALSGGSSTEDMGCGIGVDNNANVYVTGNFKSTATFATSSVTSAGDFDVFLAKIPSTFVYVAPIITGTTLICTVAGSTTLTISNPQAGYIYNWYTVATGGTIIATGTSYTTPVLTATTTYYVEVVNSETCITTRVPVTVTVNNSCCPPFTMSMSTTSQSVNTGSDVNYSITLTNTGTAAITVNNFTSIASVPAFTVTAIIPSPPYLIQAGNSVTVIVTGNYATSSNPNYFDKCFSATVGYCTYPQVCQQTMTNTSTPASENADFTINNNIAPIATTEAIALIANAYTGSHDWSVYYNGIWTTIGNTSNFSYAFPAPGTYVVRHIWNLTKTITKSIVVTGENTAINFSTAEVSTPTKSNYGIGNYTLEAYVKPTTLPTIVNSKSCFISNMQTGNGFEFGVNAAGKLYLQINGSIFVNTTGPTLTNGTCYHAAVTRSGTTFTFYLDGTSTGTFASALTPTYNGTLLFLGKSTYADGYSTGQFIGLMEDVRIWSVARTQSQISSNRYVTLVGTESGLISYWPINEGSGTTIKNSVSNLSATLIGQTWTTLSCGSGVRTADELDASDLKATTEIIRLFPVPFNEETSIEVMGTEQTPVSIEIIDVMGTVVYSARELKSNTTYMIGKDFATGFYTVRAEQDGRTQHYRIVKQ